MLHENKEGQAFIRDDYRELALGSLRLLGCRINSEEMIWKKCGAAHKARFAAFGIYSNKALAFSKQLELDEETVSSLLRFSSFFTTLYIPHFLRSSIGCDAAVNDLAFYKHLFHYKNVDSSLAEAGLDVMRRHGWYLVPELIPCALFSNKLEDEEKSRLASKMLTFKEVKKFVKVVNDLAERGIKLISDYAQSLTKDDEMREILLHGVEANRKKFPDFKKQTLNT